MLPPGLTHAWSYFIDTAAPKQNSQKDKKHNKTVDKSEYQQLLQVGIHLIFIPSSVVGITPDKQSDYWIILQKAI